MKKRTAQMLKGRIICLTLLFVFASIFSYSQQVKTITGTVKDASGVLPDVSVVIKGSPGGTSTDANGTYSIKAKRGDVLIYSRTEYEDQEIVVGEANVINISLISTITAMGEVVVVGYGTQSKRNITGSISKVDMTDTKNLPNTNFSQAIRGRVAGVQFTDNGRPGQNGDILIRGRRSLNASNDPLIILDGIFFHGSKQDINFNDVESIEILKDASASAIYGSRAANGVILITTKKGNTEKPTIRFNSFYATSDWANRVKWLSPEKYIQKTLDVREINGLPHDPADIGSYLTTTEANNYAAGKVTDPVDAISQQGQLFSADLSVSGRSKNSNYYLSGSIANEQGLTYGDKEDKKTFRVNLETNIKDWLKIGTNSMLSTRDGSGLPATVGITTNRLSPFGTWYYDDGMPTQYVVPEDPGITRNTMRLALLTDKTLLENNLFSNVYGIVSIPQVEGLKYRINYSNSYRWIRDYSFERQDIHLVGSNNTNASKRNRNNKDWVVENILTYQFNIKNEHAFDATLLYGLKGNSFETTTASNTQFATDLLGWNNLGLGTLPYVYSYAQETKEVSSMARLNYRFKNRYLFTFTARRDGSSVFAADNKYATFPSGAFAWIASEEKFLRNVDFLNTLKFRISYGAVGNQGIVPYQSLSLAGTTTYVFGDGASTSIGMYPSSIPSADLKWETTYTTNLAVDFGLFDGRLGGTLEWYNLKTKDLIVERTLPSATGFSSIWTNLGEVNNKGFEATINSINIKRGKFEWSTDFVFSYNKNKIVHLYGGDVNGDGKEDDDISNGWFIGQPINVYYDFIFDGIYQDGDVIPAGSQPGFARFKDLNKDGKIDASNDRGIVGQSVNPKYRWGINNTFNYGNLQLSVFINAMQGWIGVFNELDNFYTGDPMRPVTMLDAGYWTPENKSTTRPSLKYNRSVLGHSWYVSRDFIRVQDVSLAYTFPKKVLDKFKLTNLGVNVSGKNLFTSTDWLGTNPEVITSYPLPRSFSIGLNVGF